MPKRKSSRTPSPSPTKKRRSESPALEWPAPAFQIQAAQDFIRECIRDKHLVLLIPDKDADGLSAGKIMHHTLTTLGHPSDLIKVHLVSKSASVFTPSEKTKMEASGATRVIVMDQGSRGGPALVDEQGGKVKTLIMDHHQSDEFPENATVATACRSPPVATAALLVYYVCYPLHPSLKEKLAWIAILGAVGDLGNTIPWGTDPWPEYLGQVSKKVTKKAISSAVALVNAPGRANGYKIQEAWEAVLRAETVQDLLKERTFQDARDRVTDEVERCTHTAPKFSKDGRVALFRISSEYRVHPLIATRWAGFLKSAKLQLVMCANDQYNPSGEHTNFSCRIAAGLRKLPDGERPNLIEILKEFGNKVEDPEFMNRVGGDFAKGHKEATGGIILTRDFDLFCEAMEIGVKPDDADKTPRKKKPIDPNQKTKITSFFSPKAKKEEASTITL